MAAIAPYIPPQQQAPAQAPAAAATSQDPLFDALVKYITSGVNAQSISHNDIHTMYTSAISEPEGAMALENLLASSPSDSQGRQWQNVNIIDSGRAKTTTDSFSFEFVSHSSKVSCTGKTSRPSRNGSADLGGGSFYSNDYNAVRGLDCDFSAKIYKTCNVSPTLIIDFTSNGDLIGCLEVPNTSLILLPNTNGNCTFK